MEYREPLRTGTVLAGDYRIEEVIGAGGFGITYLAQDLKLGRPVAIKEYFPAEFALRDASKSVRARSGERGETFKWGYDSFIKEAQLLARFDHPAIARVQRILEANDTAYMVMRYEEGHSLGEHLAALGRPMTETEIRRLAYPVLEALELVHSHAILHRDISPENLIVRPDGRGVLIDFGAARQAVAGRSRLMTGIVREGYSAPEQYSQGGPKQGPWTDVYGLGAVLYQAATGVKPLTSPHRMIEDTLSPAAGRPDGAGSHLLAGIDQALRLKPAERPQSIAALRRAMSGQAPVDEPTVGAAVTATAVAAAGSPLPSPFAATLVATGSGFDRLAGAGAVRPGNPPAAAPVAAAKPASPAGGVAGRNAKPQWMPIGQLLFSFRGRINRAKLWLGTLLNLSVLLACVVTLVGVHRLLKGNDELAAAVVAIGTFVALLLSTWIAFALYAKRAHDRGWSGWFSLLTLVPLVQFWPLIELLFLPGDPGRNRFGVDPLAPEAETSMPKPPAA